MVDRPSEPPQNRIMTAETHHPAHACDTIRFVLNGELREVRGVPPDLTVLRWLRDHARLTGTKEGCAEGDCGACTVIVGSPDGRGGLRRRSENACIRLLPQLHGLSLETIEHLGSGHADGLHPVQRELIDRHGSQCGFCTPGIAMRLAAGAVNGELTDRDAVVDALSGNLCRCTGYGPIVEAGLAVGRERIEPADDDTTLDRLREIEAAGPLAYEHEGRSFHQPRTMDAVAALARDDPGATLVAGGTDVGLWVAKLHRRLDAFIEVGRVAGADRIERDGGGIRVGPAVTHEALRAEIGPWHRDLDELMRRFAGHQTREVGTVCGNVANGSPIGDLNPTLIALGATVRLRLGEERRGVPIEDLFVEYGVQDRRPGEIVEGVDVPRLRDDHLLHVSKVSKRIESDISAVLGAFRLSIEDGRVTGARLAYGGMAGTAKRAAHAEAALVGGPFDRTAVTRASEALSRDFEPLTDMRASAAYRLEVAGNLLHRFLDETERGGTLRDLGPVLAEAAE